MPEAAAVATIDAPTTADAGPDAAAGATPAGDAAPAKPPEPKPEPKPEPRRFKARVNGREVELPEDEVINAGLSAAQMRRAASEQFEKAQKLHAEVADFKQRFEADPMAALEGLAGGSPKLRQAVEAYLVKQIQYEQLDPNERARMEAEKALATERKQRETLERAQTDREQQALQQHVAAQYDKDFGEALTSSGLPKTVETVRRMAVLARKANEMGLEVGRDVSAKQLSALVRQEIIAEQASVLSSLDGEALLNAMGPDLRRRFRAAEVAAVKAGQPKPPVPSARPVAAPARSDEPNPHLMTRDEWRRRHGFED